ncbi:MAG: glycoside hydrolase family 97 N-terminal domain-containing protein [Oscillospiraceae bacterium]|nr:glycoside hydrolase family 97 N-terminal domain-containing protein [Oscillospiraceae bacterium]
MNLKKIISLKLIVLLLILIFVTVSVILSVNLLKKRKAVVFSAPSDAEEIHAPDVDLHMYLWLQEGVPYYSIVYKGEEVVNASKMGLNTSLGNLSENFVGIDEMSSDSQDTSWSPIVGEKAVIHNKYNEKVFRLNQNGNLSLTIEMRAYNTGVAFRYILPDASVFGDYSITDEQTSFALSPDGIALSHENGQQQLAKKHRIKNLPKNTAIHPPLTAVFDSGKAMTLALSNLENYAYMKLQTESKGCLKPIEETVFVTQNEPKTSPYWTFVIGDTLSDLPVNKDIILNLNDEPDEEKYHYSEWVKSGKALMLGLFNETTETMRLQVDTAKKCGLDYLILDFGWYGPEFDERSDPRLDPQKLVPDSNDSPELAAAKEFVRPYVTVNGTFNAVNKPFNVYEKCPWGGDIQMAPNLNIPEIIQYANSQGIGIFLYVNAVQLNDKLNRYDVDELFDQFAAWGVSGVKPGFVPDKSQTNEKITRNIIEAAARHKLMLTVHDEWIQTGIEREFPNLLAVEGVLGDEGLTSKQIEGDLNALFARGIQGFADHTICYPGKASRGFQLASSVLWPTGLNCVYWPWKNTDTQNRETIENLSDREREFWKEMPATWDDLVILKAEVSKTAATARRTGDVWYVGAISAVSQDIKLPLDFLDGNTQYVAEIYYDRSGNDGRNSNRDNSTSKAHILYTCCKVDSKTELEKRMKYGTGLAVRIRPAEKGDENIADYNSNTLK